MVWSFLLSLPASRRRARRVRRRSCLRHRRHPRRCKHRSCPKRRRLCQKHLQDCQKRRRLCRKCRRQWKVCPRRAECRDHLKDFRQRQVSQWNLRLLSWLTLEADCLGLAGRHCPSCHPRRSPSRPNLPQHLPRAWSCRPRRAVLNYHRLPADWIYQHLPVAQICRRPRVDWGFPPLPVLRSPQMMKLMTSPRLNLHCHRCLT